MRNSPQALPALHDLDRQTLKTLLDSGLLMFPRDSIQLFVLGVVVAHIMLTWFLRASSRTRVVLTCPAFDVNLVA